MNNYLTSQYKRENKVITIYYQKLPFQISFIIYSAQMNFCNAQNQYFFCEILVT